MAALRLLVLGSVCRRAAIPLRWRPALVSYVTFLSLLSLEIDSMGRGDRKTRKGKTSIRSYGNARPHKAAAKGAVAAKKPATPKPAAKKAAPAVKKAAPKKSA